MKSNKGFLLFEMLVALSILLAGLILISRSFSVALSAAAKSKDYLTAANLLEKKAIEAQVGEKKEDGQGAFEEDRDFSWKQTVSDLDADSGLKKVEISVDWEKGQKVSGSTGLVTYVIKR